MRASQLDALACDDEAPTDFRSSLMARVRAKDTKPELVVRRLAHGLGYRFRLHRRDLPGSPDLVFPSRNKVVFAHGCFWHRHPACHKASTPKTRRDFWQTKFNQNVDRDIRKEIQLMAAGWEVLVIWECETRETERLTQTISNFLGAPGKLHRF
jgi:DNA mismatch endonuclease (patch repair protein)